MNPDSITHILFDLGNVLVELNRISNASVLCPALRAAHQPEFAIVTDYECGRVSTAAFLAAAPRALGLTIAPDALQMEFQRIVGQWYPHTPELLETLRKSYRLGCLSNTNPLHIEALRQRGPHLDLLHDCFMSHEIGYMKPDPEAYDAVLEVWQIRPNQILFIDDRPENVEAAAKAGMQAFEAHGPDAVAAVLHPLCKRS
ncbi:MAG: HAD family hydrolase [Kiritimatiellia bacterium]